MANNTTATEVSATRLPIFSIYPEGVFLNPDPRLRPRWVMPEHTGMHKGYAVTEFSFPELYKEFMQMKHYAGLDNTEIKLVISDEISPFAGRYDHTRKTIYLNRRVVNAYTFEMLLFMPLGHEFGHAWRMHNPDKKSFPSLAMFKSFSSSKWAETEADLIGVCLQGTTKGINDWMDNRYHGNSDYPTNDELKSALQQLKWSDCPDNTKLPHYDRTAFLAYKKSSPPLKR